jgi:hypothetical protein
MLSTILNNILLIADEEISRILLLITICAQRHIVRYHDIQWNYPDRFLKEYSSMSIA